MSSIHVYYVLSLSLGVLSPADFSVYRRKRFSAMSAEGRDQHGRTRKVARSTSCCCCCVARDNPTLYARGAESASIFPRRRYYVSGFADEPSLSLSPSFLSRVRVFPPILSCSSSLFAAAIAAASCLFSLLPSSRLL